MLKIIAAAEPLPKSLTERLLSKVTLPREPDGCWAWTGATRRNKSGMEYGAIGEGGRGGKMLSAHRASYMLFRQNHIPVGAVVRHSCDNTLCVNPEHLILGSHQDNMDDMVARGRSVGLPGEKQPNAKISEAQAIEIIRLKKLGISTTKIMALVPITRQQINRINSGRRWNHLQEEN